MENQDLDLIGKTVGNMPYKIGIIDQSGQLKKQFVANASTNRIDIPEQLLSGSGSTGGSKGGNTSGTAGGNTGAGNNAPSQVSQLPSTVNLFSGSAIKNILLSGSTPNYSNIQDGLLITLSNLTLGGHYHNAKDQAWLPNGYEKLRLDLSSIGLKPIKIPKEKLDINKLIVNNSIDISDQLSQYIGKTVKAQYATDESNNWIDTGKPTEQLKITSFEGTINVLPNTTLSMNIIVKIDDVYQDDFQIPVIRVNDYKN